MDAGDVVEFKWFEGTLTGRLLQHPYPNRKYLRVRTASTSFSVPKEDILRVVEEATS